MSEVSSSYAESPQRQPSSIRSILISLSCTGALVTQLFGSTSVAISLPTIGKELGIPENQLQWLVSAYALSSGCLLLFFGRIADLYGRKRTFCLGLSWTLAFSIGCGFANDYLTLAILRAMQGLGLAAAIPSALGILALTFAEGSKARSTAFATFSAGAPLGSALGGVIGGALIEIAPTTWRTPFYFTSGLVFTILMLGFLSFDNDVPSESSDKRIDWLGAFLVTAGLVLIVFVLGQGEIATQRWRTPYIIALLIVGVLFLLLFAAWERHLERLGTRRLARQQRPPTPPLMKMSLLGRGGGRYAVMMLITLLEYTCFMSWYFWMQIYFQDYLHLSPLHSALRLLAMPVTGVMINVLIALIIGLVPLVYLLSFGALMTGAATIIFATMDPSRIYWAAQFPALVISVWGADFIYAGGSLYIAKLSKAGEQSVGGGLFQTMTQLGAAFGVTITTVVFNRVNGYEATGSASLSAFRAAWWTSTGFALLAALLSAAFFYRVGVVGHKKDDSRQSKVVKEEEVQEKSSPETAA